MAAKHPHLFSAAIPISGMPESGIVGKLKDIPVYVIHSRDDEVIPLRTVEKFVRELDSGMSVEFVVVDGITHYDFSGFTVPLKGAIPWVKRVWQQ